MDICFVIHDGCCQDMSLALSCFLGLYHEEILERSGAVKARGKVGQVISKLHRLVMNAIGPPAQHGHGRIGTDLCTIARILEMLKVDHLVRLGGIQIGRDSGTEHHLAAMAIFHEQLDGSEGAVIPTYIITAWSPGHGAGTH